MNSGVFMKALDIFCIYVILNLWIGGYSQQTIHNWIANNEWSGAGFPKLRLPGPCEQVFGFSRSLCSCGSFLLPCSHGFRQSFSRSRKGGPYVLYYPLERTKRRVSMSGNGLAAHLALYAGCITNCIFRWLWDGGYDAWIAVYVGLSRTFGPEALFFLSALRCSYSRVQTSERNVFPGLWIRLTSLLQNVKFSNGWAFWHVRVTWI